MAKTASRTKKLSAKISGKPSHDLLAVRANGTEAVRIGSGWSKVDGTVTLKIDLLPVNYQTVILKPGSPETLPKPKAFAGRPRRGTRSRPVPKGRS
jgi:hypothetical protein